MPAAFAFCVAGAALRAHQLHFALQRQDLEHLRRVAEGWRRPGSLGIPTSAEAGDALGHLERRLLLRAAAALGTHQCHFA